MSNLTTYQFQDHSIRVVTLDGDPWFVAIDALRVLYDRASQQGTTAYLSKLGDDECQWVKRSNLSPSAVSFPNRGANCVSESGLYKLVMRSDSPAARPFQDWVTRTVLPAIRKDGAYVHGEEKVASGAVLHLPAACCRPPSTATSSFHKRRL